jgi:diaminohydroxyphosphoribosylaminopyrimidine deaminase/5-amino-6-(5-phosphoribosylamino)uracil reductase
MSEARDTEFMRRAVELAAAQLGRTGDNPAVGCVIVRDGEIIAEAATAEGGRPHAEEQALAAAGERASGATAYVTLEPCGERSSGAPSCAARLADAGVARVVIGCANPHGLSAGRGPELLRGHGVQVETAVEADTAQSLYADFLARLASGGSSRARKSA